MTVAAAAAATAESLVTVATPEVPRAFPPLLSLIAGVLERAQAVWVPRDVEAPGSPEFLEPPEPLGPPVLLAASQSVLLVLPTATLLVVEILGPVAGNIGTAAAASEEYFQT